MSVTIPPHLLHAGKNLGSIQQAAQRAAVSDRTIRRYIAAGMLDGYRVGRKLLRVDLDQVDALIRQIPTVGGDAA